MQNKTRSIPHPRNHFKILDNTSVSEMNDQLVWVWGSLLTSIAISLSALHLLPALFPTSSSVIMRLKLARDLQRTPSFSPLCYIPSSSSSATSFRKIQLPVSSFRCAPPSCAQVQSTFSPLSVEHIALLRASWTPNSIPALASFWYPHRVPGSRNNCLSVGVDPSTRCFIKSRLRYEPDLTVAAWGSGEWVSLLGWWFYVLAFMMGKLASVSYHAALCGRRWFHRVVGVSLPHSTVSLGKYATDNSPPNATGDGIPRDDELPCLKSATSTENQYFSINTITTSSFNNPLIALYLWKSRIQFRIFSKHFSKLLINIEKSHCSFEGKKSYCILEIYYWGNLDSDFKDIARNLHKGR